MDAGSLSGDTAITLYYMYRVWTFFTLSIVGVALFARFVPVIGEKSKWMDRVALVDQAGSGGQSLPRRFVAE